MPREIVRKPRLIYPQIATSLSIANVSALAELLFWRMLPQADDQGRLPGDPRQLKAVACPMREELTAEKIPELLTELEETELIIQYSNTSKPYIQISKWWDYQAGMRRVFPSRYPAPEGWVDRPPKGVERVDETGPKVAEAAMSDILYQGLVEGRIKLGQAALTEVNREVRIGSSYIDLLAKDLDGRFYLVEVKRTKLANSHIEKILLYKDLLEAKAQSTPSLILIGYNTTATFNPSRAAENSVNVITYDDELDFRQLVLADVQLTAKSQELRQLLLTHVKHPKPEEEEEVEPEPEKEPESQKPEPEEGVPTAAAATSEEENLLQFLKKLKRWRFERDDDLAWLREFRSEFGEFTLAAARATRDYHSGRSPPKQKGGWKNRFRQWMIHEHEFARERGETGERKGQRVKGARSASDFSSGRW